MLENGKGCRLGTRRCQPNGLAQIVHCVLDHGKHTRVELSPMVGARSDKLARVSDGLSEDLPLRVAISATLLQHDTRIIEEVCRRVGGVFVPMPDAHITDEDVYAALTAVVEEIGQDSGVVRRILADRAVTPDEADEAEREIDETIARAVALKAAIRRKVANVVSLSPASRRSA